MKKNPIFPDSQKILEVVVSTFVLYTFEYQWCLQRMILCLYKWKIILKNWILNFVLLNFSLVRRARRSQCRALTADRFSRGWRVLGSATEQRGSRRRRGRAWRRGANSPPGITSTTTRRTGDEPELGDPWCKIRRRFSSSSSWTKIDSREYATLNSVFSLLRERNGKKENYI